MSELMSDNTKRRTSFGEYVERTNGDDVELWSQSGQPLAKLTLPADMSDEDRMYAKLQALCEYDIDLIRERASRPASEGLTTAELLARLEKIGTEK